MAVARGRSWFNWDKLVDDALRFQSQSLIQRLGYLCDLFEAPWTGAARARLKAQRGRGKHYLSQTSRWGDGRPLQRRLAGGGQRPAG